MIIEDRPAFAEINLGNLIHNLNVIKDLIRKDVEILAVIKADAYGHGIEKVFRTLNGSGIKYFGVACSEEAESILKINSDVNVLSFGKIYKKDILLAKRFKNYNLTISGFDCVNYLDTESEYNVQINVDTGMGRCGIFVDDLKFLLDKLNNYKNVNLTGVYSHFPSADLDIEYTKKQIEIFSRIRELFIEKGYKNLKFHISNSDGIVNFPEANFDMVRPGITLYGGYWNIKKKRELGLKPVMKFYSKVVQIKNFKKGMSIGYKRKFIVPFDNFKAGLVPIGYADGYLRFFSNKSRVLIKNRLCRVIGLVSMDWMMVDLNGVENPQIGDEVILFGDEGYFVDVDELAEKIGTISYELLCRIGNRVKRIYKEGL